MTLFFGGNQSGFHSLDENLGSMSGALMRLERRFLQEIEQHGVGPSHVTIKELSLRPHRFFAESESSFVAKIRGRKLLSYCFSRETGEPKHFDEQLPKLQEFGASQLAQSTLTSRRPRAFEFGFSTHNTASWSIASTLLSVSGRIFQ